MNQVLTAGYSGHTAAQLKQAAESLNARVLDIRLSPKSRIPEWNEFYLKEALGWRYYHLPALGNLNYKTGEAIKIQHPVLGCDIVAQLQETKSLILLCGCADYHSCHRADVSLLLAARGIHTKELAWPEVERVGSIKCISLWQPWASLVAIGAKQIETRHWATSYRGPLAIHAAKRWTREEKLQCRQPYLKTVLEEAGLAKFDLGPETDTFHLPFGAVLAVAELAECIPTREIILTKGAPADPITAHIHEQFMHGQKYKPGQEFYISPQERAFGNYAPGRFAWALKNIRLLKEPVPYRGAQSLFNVPADILKMKEEEDEGSPD